MIYTVTFNPSLDYIVKMDSFATGEINRVNYEQVLAGGKGINVSIVLKNLGQNNTALGFLAGFTGEEIKRQLHEFGVTNDFVQLNQGFSRINVKAKAENETEINGQGPDIDEAKLEELFTKLDQLQADDTLVLAGSIPKTLPDDIYQQIIAIPFLVRKNVTRTAQVTITIIMVSKNAVMPDDISLPKALWNILYTVSAGLFTATPKLFFASYCK